MKMKDSMTRKLETGLAPDMLEVIDESHLHAGHAGWHERGETHFRIEVVARAFSGKSRLERHRMVNALVADELRSGVHALAISARAPDE
jgi:BolA protein